MSKKPMYPALSILAAAALALTGCAPSASTQAEPAAAAVDSSTTASLSVSQPWIKAAASGMTGGFGVITNTSDADITVSGASSPAARSVELHETVTAPNGAMQMRAKEGGFIIPAGGELRLEPGANHLMLMGLSGPVTPGTEVAFTLELAGGGSFEFTALAKDFSGANENYVGEGAGMSHGQPSGSAESGAENTAGAMPTSK